MNVVFSAQARRDLEGIAAYHRRSDPGLASVLIDRILEATRILGENPHVGPATGRPRERRWHARRTPYLVLYRIEAARVLVLRVRHEARMPLSG